MIIFYSISNNKQYTIHNKQYTIHNTQYTKNKLFAMSSKKVHTLEYNSKEYIITIEKKPYILDKTIQPVYKYYIDDTEVLTYYTNGATGANKTLYPVYHNQENYSKDILDALLATLIPKV